MSLQRLILQSMQTETEMCDNQTAIAYLETNKEAPNPNIWCRYNQMPSAMVFTQHSKTIQQAHTRISECTNWPTVLEGSCYRFGMVTAPASSKSHVIQIGVLLTGICSWPGWTWNFPVFLSLVSDLEALAVDMLSWSWDDICALIHFSSDADSSKSLMKTKRTLIVFGDWRMSGHHTCWS